MGTPLMVKRSIFSDEFVTMNFPEEEIETQVMSGCSVLTSRAGTVESFPCFFSILKALSLFWSVVKQMKFFESALQPTQLAESCSGMLTRWYFTLDSSMLSKNQTRIERSREAERR
eukprot:Lithocolla_globosa_v1_NODE_7951_length_882_cov_3.445652.p2 type:complete len:116 gc:universal NODE_7951_length_882_cov_3.445652:393-740(+)